MVILVKAKGPQGIHTVSPVDSGSNKNSSCWAPMAFSSFLFLFSLLPSPYTGGQKLRGLVEDGGKRRSKLGPCRPSFFPGTHFSPDLPRPCLVFVDQDQRIKCLSYTNGDTCTRSERWPVWTRLGLHSNSPTGLREIGGERKATRAWVERSVTSHNSFCLVKTGGPRQIA